MALNMKRCNQNGKQIVEWLHQYFTAPSFCEIFTVKY